MLSDGQVGLLVAKIETGLFKEIPPECAKESDGIEDKYRFMRHIEKLEEATDNDALLTTIFINVRYSSDNAGESN